MLFLNFNREETYMLRVQEGHSAQETQGKNFIAQIFVRIFTYINNAWKTMVNKLTFFASLEKRTAKIDHETKSMDCNSFSRWYPNFRW
jgi:hypothetical protein